MTVEELREWLEPLPAEMEIEVNPGYPSLDVEPARRLRIRRDEWATGNIPAVVIID